MVRESLRDNDLNPWSVSQNLEREIVTVQFQIMGAQGAPGISPADWAASTDPRRVPRIFLVLKSEVTRELFLEKGESLKLFFFFGAIPRKEECLLHGFFNLQSREKRRSASSLEQGFESNRADLQLTIQETAGAAEAVNRVVERRDGVHNAEKKREANETLQVRCEMLLKTLTSLPHKACVELSQAARQNLESILSISPHLNATEFNKQCDNLLPTSWVSKILDGINAIGDSPPVSIWIQGVVFQTEEETVRKGSPKKKSWGQRDRLETVGTMLAPSNPLHITAVFEFKTLKMAVIDMRSEEVETLMKASNMQKDKLTRGVVTGTYTAKGEWGTVKVKCHTKGLGVDDPLQPVHDQISRLLWETLDRGEMFTVPRRSFLFGSTIVDGDDRGELTSDVADLVQGPDPGRWRRLDGDGSDEIYDEDLIRALKTVPSLSSTLSLTEAIR